MKLRQIEVFRAVMKTGSISAASGFLHVSQSAISQVLIHTEQQLKFPLFNRVKGRLQETQEARTLFREIEQVYAGVLRVNELAESLKRSHSGIMQILASPGPGHALLPEAVRRFRYSHPGIRIGLDMLSYGPMMEKLKTNQADFAVVMCPEEERDVRTSHLCDASLVCLLPTAHPLCGLQVISPSDLGGQQLIAFAGGSALGRLIADAFEQSGEAPDIAVEVAFGISTPNLVRCGVGIAIIDSLTALSVAAPDLTTRPFSSTGSFEVVVMQSAERPASRDGEAFIASLRASAKRLALAT